MIAENNIRVERYDDAKHKERWNAFVQDEQEAIFLFHRDFLAYHNGRFTDHSLLVSSEKGQLLMIVAGNAQKDHWYSHQGLTYGGVVKQKQLSFTKFRSCWHAMLDYLKQSGFKRMTICPMPFFYHPFGNDMQEIALHQSGAVVSKRKSSFLIDRSASLSSAPNVRRAAEKAKKQDCLVKESEDFEVFWNQVLRPMMQSQFGKEPLHSVEEICYLKGFFPDSIKLWVCYDRNNELQAGTVLFIHQYCIHTQYIAASPKAKKMGALSLLMTELITHFREDIRYFDLGSANIGQTSEIDEGLAFWKERLGARPIAQDTYTLSI